MTLRHLCIIFVVATCMLIFVGACKKNNDASSEVVGQDEVIFGVVGQTVVPTNIERKLPVDAMIRSSVVVNVMPEKEGTLKALRVRAGDVVKKGQTLGVIDASKAGSTFLTSPLIASVSGQISEVFANVGNEVSLTKAVVEIIDNAQLELRIAVSEQDVPFITIGTRGKLTLSLISKGDGGAQNSFDIRVLSISHVFSNRSSTMHIRVALSGLVPHVRTGMTGVLSLVLEEKQNVVSVPKKSIVRRFADGSFKEGVFVIDDGKKNISNVSFRPLELGIESINNENEKITVVEVLTGLAFDEVIIVKGYSALADKVKARILNIDGISPSEQ